MGDDGLHLRRAIKPLLRLFEREAGRPGSIPTLVANHSSSAMALTDFIVMAPDVAGPSGPIEVAKRIGPRCLPVIRRLLETAPGPALPVNDRAFPLLVTLAVHPGLATLALRDEVLMAGLVRRLDAGIAAAAGQAAAARGPRGQNILLNWEPAQSHDAVTILIMSGRWQHWRPRNFFWGRGRRQPGRKVSGGRRRHRTDALRRPDDDCSGPGPGTGICISIAFQQFNLQPIVHLCERLRLVKSQAGARAAKELIEAGGVEWLTALLSAGGIRPGDQDAILYDVKTHAFFLLCSLACCRGATEAFVKNGVVAALVATLGSRSYLDWSESVGHSLLCAVASLSLLAMSGCPPGVACLDLLYAPADGEPASKPRATISACFDFAKSRLQAGRDPDTLFFSVFVGHVGALMLAGEKAHRDPGRRPPRAVRNSASRFPSLESFRSTYLHREAWEAYAPWSP